MTQPQACPADEKGIGFFERYLTVWVGLCIVAGIALGKVAPEIAKSLDGMAIYVNDAPVISIPIAWGQKTETTIQVDEMRTRIASPK